MQKLLLYFNTIRFLKWQQIYYRFRRKVIKPSVKGEVVKISPERPVKWHHMLLYSDKLDNNMTACFLNERKALDLPGDWNNNNLSKLWLYNLHYFEDLLSKSSNTKVDLHLDMLNRWVEENPVGHGNGWEPYTISLRIVNILKGWFGGLNLDEKLFLSLFEQACFLSTSLEKHILGNHYFANLKALIFMGLVFENKKWIADAEKALLREIPEQILPDGANFELSPMYHSLMLVDMLDLLNLSRAYPNALDHNLVNLIESKIPKMLAFLESMSHPDQGLSFFNDSVNGIAPAKSDIEKYARKLGFYTEQQKASGLIINDFYFSGYFSAMSDSAKLIFDAAEIGPTYIPGHAHADSLSFELSIGLQRVFVNSGISEYGITENRIRQRETRSHNTVEIDNKNSSEVWSGFRVANRANIIGRSARIVEQAAIHLEATHDGYKNFFGGCTHTRKLCFSDNYLIVNDSFEGKCGGAIARFFIHPELLVSLKDDNLEIRGSNFLVQSNLCNRTALVLPSTWHPEFGINIQNHVLEVDLSDISSSLTFTWERF